MFCIRKTGRRHCSVPAITAVAKSTSNFQLPTSTVILPTMTSIASMTAFAQHTLDNAEGTALGSASWEIRSVNHRYLDINFRIPESWRFIEQEARELIKKKLNRGRVDLTLRVQENQQSNLDIHINHDMLDKWLNVIDLLKQKMPTIDVNAMSVLSANGVVSVETAHNVEEYSAQVLLALDQALDKLIAVRQREGEALRQGFIERIELMRVQVNKAREAMPQILQDQKQKLVSQLEELQVKVDNDRLEQELVLLTQKTDVAEELERLDVHLVELERLFAKGGVMGRRLDFLMQELNREANTLGSKSINSVTTQASVELKVLIEQMREQVQNLE